MLAAARFVLLQLLKKKWGIQEGGKVFLFQEVLAKALVIKEKEAAS